MAVTRVYTLLTIALLGGCAATPSPRVAPHEAPPAVAPTPIPARESALAESVHVALGIPEDGDASDDLLLDRGELVISYNPRLNAANWVAWHLDASDLGDAKRSGGFHIDRGLPSFVYAARDEDYVRSGYDRGHLCPSADRTRSPEQNRTTFVLSNVHPQRHELNAGPWERLERYERELAQSGKEVFLIAGGLFDANPPRIGREAEAARRVAVPRASYKVLVALERGQRAADVRADSTVLAVSMPNEADLAGRSYQDFVLSVRELERLSGYDFNRRVPRDVQDVIETRSAAGQLAN